MQRTRDLQGVLGCLLLIERAVELLVLPLVDDARQLLVQLMVH